MVKVPHQQLLAVVGQRNSRAKQRFRRRGPDRRSQQAPLPFAVGVLVHADRSPEDVIWEAQGHGPAVSRYCHVAWERDGRVGPCNDLAQREPELVAAFAWQSAHTPFATGAALRVLSQGTAADARVVQVALLCNIERGSRTGLAEWVERSRCLPNGIVLQKKVKHLLDLAFLQTGHRCQRVALQLEPKEASQSPQVGRGLGQRWCIGSHGQCE
mmetsp:Transcript_11966/g.33709  ORF Transcript_11966/g.33709 Transcript_11966/m.33709 type:complete len:213 (+) Transcript_11966:830-1468(+)